MTDQAQFRKTPTMPDKFNEPQRSRILAGVSYIDKLLIDVDQILTASSSPAFPKYRNPLTPAQVRVVRDYANRLRQQIVDVLNDLDISLPEAKLDCTHSTRVTLQFIEVAIEELAPERLGGYGDVPEHLRQLLAGGLQEMKGIVRQMDSYLVQPAGADFGARLAMLPDISGLASLLKATGRLVDKYGFVEFRATLSALVEKITTPAYEIAFFGRVSAGKSSLLNRIIGIDLLPTGVTPVTSVPTRIRNRTDPGLLVWTAEGRLTRYEIDRLADFVTEQRNPGNEKRIVRLIAELPLATLPEEIVFVDTPGLGSLASQGAAETLAYLPQCDLGVVLVDASSSIHPDDIGTLDALGAASVPSILVISKADLLPADDLQRLVKYTRDCAADQLRMDIDVVPLSSRPEMAQLLDAWVRNEIAPRVANARRLGQESSQRKTRMLAERVLDALQISKPAQNREAVFNREELKRAEAKLREAAGLIETTNEQCFRITGQTREAAELASAALVNKAVDVFRHDSAVRELDGAFTQKAINSLAQNEAETLAGIVLRTAQRLSEAINAAADATGMGGRSEGARLQNLVKGLPVAEFPIESLVLRRPHLLSISVSLARRSLREQLESQSEPALIQFLNNYGRALELWFRSTLGALQREFDANAEIYRAQFLRLLGAESQTELDNEALLEDIVFLERALNREDAIETVESHASA
jgi:GTP-binding protein EngB required for normal cell division